jgi:hypothetical protein
LGHRLVRWFTYNLIFALLPLCAAVLLRALAGKLSTDAIANSPEILFFAIMVSATAMGDLSEVTAPIDRDLILKVLQAILLIGAIWAAVLYGTLLYDSIIGPGSPSFRLGLLQVSAGLAVSLFLFSTVTQVLLGKIEGGK